MRGYSRKVVKGSMIISAIMALVLAAGLLPIDAQSPSEYVLGPGDVVDINVLGQSDLTRTLTVRPDGKIGLPLIGEVLATGLTPGQLTDRIATALRQYLIDPRVTVIVSQTRASDALIYLVGEVRNPGSYEFRRGWTVMEAIVQAGGVTEKAALRKSSLIRKNPIETIPLDLDRLIRKADASANVALQGGDVILVPEFLNRVIVAGGVRSIGAFDLKEGARVLDAIAAAGGPSDKAVLNRVAITRQSGDTRTVVATVDLKKIMRDGDQSQNIALQHGDVVYVPDNKIRWQDLLSYLGGLILVRSVFGF